MSISAIFFAQKLRNLAKNTLSSFNWKNETSLVAICFDCLNFAKYNNKALG